MEVAVFIGGVALVILATAGVAVLLTKYGAQGEKERQARENIETRKKSEAIDTAPRGDIDDIINQL